MLKNVSVDISVTDVELTDLHKFTEYHIWVTSFTTREGLPSNSIFLTSQEDSKFLSLRRGFLSSNFSFFRSHKVKTQSLT